MRSSNRRLLQGARSAIGYTGRSCFFEPSGRAGPALTKAFMREAHMAIDVPTVMAPARAIRRKIAIAAPILIVIVAVVRDVRAGQ